MADSETLAIVIARLFVKMLGGGGGGCKVGLKGEYTSERRGIRLE